jgi:flagellar basal-body rod protein FlgC
MNVFSAMEILSSALAAERTRLNVTAANLANAETTRTPEGGPYRRKDPVFGTELMTSRFHELANDPMAREIPGVRVVEITEDQQPPRMVYDPGHPDADANGFVAYPNVTMVEEMVNMIMASRAYDAGVTALQATAGIARASIKIGE